MSSDSPADGAFAPAPSDDLLRTLLDTHAPLAAAPLCPELMVYRARSLVDVWEAAEALAGQPLPSPFWAYPWAGGCALARVLLDSPELVRGARVLDFGCGGGIATLAAAYCQAADVIANDIDPWALAVTRLAAEAQRLAVRLDGRDLCDVPDVASSFDVVLCSDLSYERSQAPRQRALLTAAAAAGARVLVADAGRTYFRPDGMTLVATFDVAVPQDLEGQVTREARVWGLQHSA